MRKRSIAFDVLLALAVLLASQVEAWTGVLSTHLQARDGQRLSGTGLPPSPW